MKFKTNSEYDKLQTLIKKLFINKESIVINDQLTIEVKYGGLASYNPKYIKENVKMLTEPGLIISIHKKAFIVFQ